MPTGGIKAAHQGTVRVLVLNVVSPGKRTPDGYAVDQLLASLFAPPSTRFALSYLVGTIVVKLRLARLVTAFRPATRHPTIKLFRMQVHARAGRASKNWEANIARSRRAHSSTLKAVSPLIDSDTDMRSSA